MEFTVSLSAFKSEQVNVVRR